MKQAAQALEFEEAATYRDLYNSVKQVSQKQKITDSDLDDKDVIALYRDEEEAVVQVDCFAYVEDGVTCVAHDIDSRFGRELFEFFLEIESHLNILPNWVCGLVWVCGDSFMVGR